MILQTYCNPQRLIQGSFPPEESESQTILSVLRLVIEEEHNKAGEITIQAREAVHCYT